jgi:hypothetical protein
MKLTSIGAALLMGILNLNATHSVFAVCQGEHTIAPVLYANTMGVLWGAIMALTFWLHVRLDERPRA